MLILFFVKTVILHFRKSTKKVLKLVELINNYISRQNKKKAKKQDQDSYKRKYSIKPRSHSTNGR